MLSSDANSNLIYSIIVQQHPITNCALVPPWRSSPTPAHRAFLTLT